MTKQRRGVFSQGVSHALFGALALFMMLLMMSDSQAAIEHMRRGMLLCARTMIPSLFPFMVVSELVVRSGAGEAIARVFVAVFRPLLGLSGQGVCALLLGWLCGFPVGSRAAANYYRAGRMTMREFVLLVCVCNVPSSAFLVSAVGLCLFGSTNVGWHLVALALTSSVVVSVILRLCLPRQGVWQQRASGEGVRAAQGMTDAQLLPSSIASAAGGMLNVCATVLLFSALLGCLTRLCDLIHLPIVWKAGVFGFFELSTGVCAASSIPTPAAAIIVCAAMVGWGGLSVHCQIVSVCDGCPFPMGWFWFSRALQALFCAGGMALLLSMGVLAVPKIPEPMAWQEMMVGGNALAQDGFAGAWCRICGVLFLIALGAMVVRRACKQGGRS